jgi:hypothetical protein
MIALLLIATPLVGLGLLQLVFMLEERITDESYL